MQPHVAQVLSIFRILGVGYSKNAGFIGNLMGNNKKSDVRNNLVQIKTGEGKSIILAVVSIIFALNDFEVKCACYSKYLSKRDFESFLHLFRFLDL